MSNKQENAEKIKNTAKTWRVTPVETYPGETKIGDKVYVFDRKGTDWDNVTRYETRPVERMGDAGARDILLKFPLVGEGIIVHISFEGYLCAWTLDPYCRINIPGCKDEIIDKMKFYE